MKPRISARRALETENLPPQAWYDSGLILQHGGDLHASRACLECAVRLRANAATYLVLGNTLKLLGDFEGATRAYDAALERQPDFLEAHANAAVALHVLGRNEAALAHATRATELAPELVEPRITRALIAGRMQGFGTAIALLGEILEHEPDHPGALSALVVALVRLERFAEATVTARRAIALQPADAKLHELLAYALRMIGRYDDACAAIERAEEVAEDRSSILVSKAELSMELGRAPEAEALLLEALSLRPDLAAAWYDVVELRSFDPADPLIASMERALAASPRLAAIDDQIVMQFALGNAHLKAGNVERAFDHLARGNRLRRETFAYDVADDERTMAEIAARIGPATLVRLPDGAGSEAAPIFVVGMPRSGTTLIEHILASHPGAHGAGEVPYLMDAILAEGRAYPDLVDDLQPHDLEALRRRYLARFDPRPAPGTRIVDKMPSNFLFAGLIPLLFPRARIVHSRRDPLDTCFSCYVTMFSGRQDFAYDLTEIGRYYRAYDALMSHWRTFLGADVLLEIRYEDLVADLERTVRGLLAFCNLPWDPACVRFHETQRPVRTASKNQVRKPLYANSVGRAAAYRPFLEPVAAFVSGGLR